VAVRLDVGPVATPVTLLAAGGRELDPVGETRTLLEEVCSLSERVSLDVVEHDSPGDYPTTTIADGIAYVGLPWGHELTTLVAGIVEAGRNASSLSEDSLERLGAVDCDVSIEVFVTPT
jgi:alkyl hydroperoxide reductase subunit F